MLMSVIIVMRGMISEAAVLAGLATWRMSCGHDGPLHRLTRQLTGPRSMLSPAHANPLRSKPCTAYFR
jgi:hypothetical protein